MPDLWASDDGARGVGTIIPLVRFGLVRVGENAPLRRSLALRISKLRRPAVSNLCSR